MRLTALSALAASLFLTAGCGSGGDNSDENPPADSAPSTAGVLGPAAPAQGTPVRIGTISDGKTPFGDVSIQFHVADATIKYLNEHRSGIAGRPIQLVTCEAQADPSKSIDCANRMIQENVVAVVLPELTAMDDVWRTLHDAKMPVMLFGASSSTLLADTESTFTLGDPLFGRVSLPIQLAKDSGATKVTAIVIDVPAALSLYDTIAPPIFEEAGIGLKVVRVPPGTPDMTPQLQSLAASDPGVVQIVGNDAFCISALNGLRAIGFNGKITAIAQCITDATRRAVPADMLEGIAVAAATPIGTDNPSTRLYNAVVETYGNGIDTSSAGGVSMFIALAGFQAATEGISGRDITPEAIVAAIKAMPEKELPGAGGLRFRCNGKASPTAPAICVRGGLITTLNAKGQPTDYKAVGSSPIGG
ncbi:branched-chain amino acid ABC transporter substrate-binding protein [Pseudofrankia sp. EUN1h]|nr:branched-chain amino acid ABC transporter substrate-binding protein [Pseudofrankia sp. EUN1h]